MFQVEHMNRGADLSVLSMLLDQPGSYGRVVRDSGGEVSAIIEAKDANAKERTIREVNTGIYCASADLLRAVLPDVENANVQGEYYLTDLVQMSAGRGLNVQAVTASDPIEFLGVNTEEELAAAERVISERAQPE